MCMTMSITRRRNMPVVTCMRIGRSACFPCSSPICGCFVVSAKPTCQGMLGLPNIPWQVGFADTTKHPQIGLEQGKQALRPILMHVTTGIFLLRVIDIVMHIALQRPIAAGRVRIQPTAGLDGEVSRLLHCLHCEIAGCLDDDRPLATDPGDNRGPVFVIMASTGLAL